MVAMETMHFFIVLKSLSLRTKTLCIFGVPIIERFGDLSLNRGLQGRSN